MADLFKVETVALKDLKDHPRNYREHPDDQLEHLMRSIKEHGLYRNVVVSKDNVILAGHGVCKAARKLKMKQIPIRRIGLNHDHPKAVKLLVADNELDHLAEQDDRLLSELLRDVKDLDDLLGTGFDEMMLANLVMVTRPKSEIEDINEAAEWVGMPEYEMLELPLKIMVSFDNEKDREAFAKKIGVKLTDKTKSIWWPPREREDPGALRFETGTDG